MIFLFNEISFSRKNVAQSRKSTGIEKTLMKVAHDLNISKRSGKPFSLTENYKKCINKVIINLLAKWQLEVTKIFGTEKGRSEYLKVFVVAAGERRTNNPCRPWR